MTSGQLTWNEARYVLEGATCFWQDLDGAHLGPPPSEVPPTSLIWAWRQQSSGQQMWLARLRIDLTRVYLATHDLVDEADAEALIAWNPRDGRIQHLRWADDSAHLSDQHWRRYVEPLTAVDRVPVAFYWLAGRPVVLK